MKLSTKLVLLTTLITLLCSSGIAGIVAFSVHRMLHREMELRAQAVADGISTDLVDKIVANDSIAVREVLQGSVSRMEGVVFAFVEDFNGKLLSHTLAGPLPVALTKGAGKGAGAGGYPPSMHYDGRQVKIIPLTLVDKMQAKLVVALDLAVIDDKVHDLVMVIVLVGLLATGLAIVLAWGMANLISRPLRQLASSLQHFGEGKDIVCVAEGGGSEVQQLAEVFNGMMAARRKAEGELVASEEKFRTIANHIYNWEYWLAREGGFVYVSPSCERITGYSPDAFYRDPGLLLRIIDPEDRELFDRHLEKVGLEGECEELELRITTAKGELRWIAHACTEVYGGDGESLGRRISNRDITGRKLAENALRESEQKFRELFENVADPVYIVDDHGQILAANEQACLELGYSIDELRQLHIVDLDAEYNTPEKIIGILNEMIAAHSTTFETRHKRRDGSLFPVEIKGRMIDIGGQPCLLGVARNLTERKRIEEERLAMEKQLQQAQKMEAIGTLAGGIAHDFNNILGAIIGYAEMAVEDCPVDSVAKKDIDQVLQAGYRAKALVKQILAFSRHAETCRVPVQPAVIIKETAKMLRSSMPTTIGIRQNVDRDIGSIMADPTQLQQIVMNLCTNAFHAMEDSGGVLTIALTRLTLDATGLPSGEAGVRPGDFVRLTVADSGVGIPAAMKDKVFEPYFTTKEVGKGTGMGLAIIHGIVKGYGGFIVLESELGQGTVFNVYLPAIEETALGEEEPSELPQRGNEHILLVDDEVMLAEMGKAMLERLG